MIVGTLIEDVLTGGVGTIDDPLTVGAGVSLIVGSSAATTGSETTPAPGEI